MRGLLSIISVVTVLINHVGVHALPTRQGIPQELFDDLTYYFKYASSAYSSDSCDRPNHNTMVAQFNDFITDTQGFVARDDTRKEIVVALRGSTSPTDFVVDASLTLEMFQVPGTFPPIGTTVHSGFQNAWNSVASQVISSVRSQLVSHPGYTIVTSGHSLGAALSSLAGITLQQNFPFSPIRMYTYGQPRTGNDKYASWVNDKFGHNGYRDDGIPNVVPTVLGYRHHGMEYWMKSDPPSPSTVLVCAADGEDPTCSATVLSQGINAAHVSVNTQQNYSSS
ncbi:Lipase, class 3 [Heterobasidion irregulare TC 32-1]|uniref:Lipase, class 3 n=1 Tax=Heterobasidion irregulare (strain TC 32-1) TaxID=747525 RepID=W4K0M9_HETIT|nr:Lipase, class 3 [Heterobasidion irregulare TC 32-1]ETW78686.1 Lipase, class 3 [Heterobasidion irregulare TC 32-1]